MSKLPSPLTPLAITLMLFASTPNAAGYSNDAFECYVAVYSAEYTAT